MNKKYPIYVLLFTLLFFVLITLYSNLVQSLDNVYTHLFYIPVILSGLWYYKKAIWVAILVSIFHIATSVWESGTFDVSSILRSIMFLVIAYIVGYISEKNAAIQHILQTSEQRFRVVSQSLDAGIVVHAADSSIIDSNERASILLGLSKEQLFGKRIEDTVWTFMGMDEQPMPIDQYPVNRILQTKQPINDQLLGIFQSNHKKSLWVKVNGVPLMDLQGNIYEVVISFIEVTELIHYQNKIAQSEEQYRLLTTQMQQGVALHEMVCDSQDNPIDYRFISVNHRFEELTGLRGENIIGKMVLEVLPHSEHHLVHKLGSVALTQKPIQFEEYIACIGKYFSISAYSPQYGQFAVAIDDITTRRLFENERSQREKDLLTSQKIAHLGTWRLNVKTNEVVWSEELYKMYGFDSSQQVPPYTEHMKLFTASSWDQLSTALSKTSLQGIPYELELETITKDGQNGWMWVRGEAEFDQDGTISSIYGAAQDITERKRLQQEFNQIQTKIITVLEKSPVAIESYDAHGYHTYSNEAAIQLFGVIDPDELYRLSLFENPNFSKELIDQIKNHEQISMELEYDFEKVKRVKQLNSYKSGSIILYLSITPLLTDGQSNGYIVHAEDITDSKRKQLEIEYLSNHDYLTQLYNRRYFVEGYQNFISKKCYPLGIMMIDINGLKIINDAYGHKHGDIAIKHVASLLTEIFDQEDIVARIGGDEFAILLPGKDIEKMQIYKAELIKRSTQLSVEKIDISLAIGYEVVTNSNKDIDELLGAAEKHLYRHKVTVGNSIRNHAIKVIHSTLTDKYNEEKIHSARVSDLCKEVGTYLQMSTEDVDLLGLAGLYHDIGKISMPDAILDKPGRLTFEEYEVIKTHTLVGYQILKAADEYSGLAEFALSHHERWDGSGYPKGLVGLSIPLFARIIAVCDSFEAMTSKRPYREKMSIQEAANEIIRCSGTQFDPTISRIFVSNLLHDS